MSSSLLLLNSSLIELFCGKSGLSLSSSGGIESKESTSSLWFSTLAIYSYLIESFVETIGSCVSILETLSCESASITCQRKGFYWGSLYASWIKLS